MSALFVDIILPVPIPQHFTYALPDDMQSRCEIGMRVVVPFGRKKFYSGIVAAIHDRLPDYDTKEVQVILDDRPVVQPLQLDFWAWMAEYYQCSPGEVYKAALPSGLKLESETVVVYNADYHEQQPLSDKEQQVADFLAQEKQCTVSDLSQATGIPNVVPVLHYLMSLGMIFVSEQLRESYKPKIVQMVALSPAVRNDDALRKAFATLERAPKQLEMVMQLMQLAGYKAALEGAAIARADLLAKGGSAAQLAELMKKGIVMQIEKVVGRIDTQLLDTLEPHPLTPVQQTAIEQLRNLFQTQHTVLLHGVTSSGKTELYIHLIHEQIAQGKQVLYLLPEIALTTQITTRLRRHFGNRLAIYHSKYSDAERVEIWNDLLAQGNFNVVLGARSAIFLPFTNLGLIIVDEEHEPSYKQYDPAPRYHARDAAMVLARLHGARVLLGTATPAIDTYHNVQTGKFGLVQLFDRYQGILMPQILVADVRDARRKKQMRSHFTPLLIEHITRALADGEQVILFQNRRGFAPYLECGQCANIPKCDHCDVSLTYHKHHHILTCHYCGATRPVPVTCPACGAPSIETRGFGTEKIEEEIKLIFPDARVARMDLDTARTRKAHEQLIHDFEQHAIDILIGTQMISKGLDFDAVSLVGILDADAMLNYPDFRAFERAFQLMAQVSGRAGRKNRQGTVILQTTNPDHPVIQQVITNNFAHHYAIQIAERETFKYPPFYRLINITLKHKDQNKTHRAADNLALALRHLFGDRVLGPQDPVIARIQNLYIRQIVLKIEKKASPARAKQLIQQAIHALVAQPEYRSLIVQIDVDPM
ncbi:replication restart DNA helicase PriA [Breznakibacter xylanolyticus]|uniref:Replication restart protein PriA n=1 Tax=Breznakibacter xylanolyticus TaxID=990 RepID=A0A2W7MUJ8_9BACT|nr:primosomal protein N' [Breznakibacter xylanolyticus]PZX11815.1 replication restart DNA helicase PriA [Breznakibacter xylanolyticus]